MKRIKEWLLYLWVVHIEPKYYRYIWYHFRGVEIGKLDDYSWSGGKRYRSYPVRHGVILGTFRKDIKQK